MIIDCISDLHGHYPKLEGGDLLIVAGDLTSNDTIYEHANFQGWLNLQYYKKKIFIAGNHDKNIDKNFCWDESIEFLSDSGTEFEGLKIWGSPWSLWFEGINPHCTAFTGSEEDLAAKFALIPDDTDILITHSPPYMILDSIPLNKKELDKSIKKGFPTFYRHAGSVSLRVALERVKPRLHVFGHIHEHCGEQIILKHEGPNTICVNASIVDEMYTPILKPVRIIL